MLVTGIVPWEGDTGQEICNSMNKEISDVEGFKGFLVWFHSTMGASAECQDFMIGQLVLAGANWDFALLVWC